MLGVAPVLGGLMLGFVFVKSCIDLADPANSESGDSWFGLRAAARHRDRVPAARRRAHDHLADPGPSGVLRAQARGRGPGAGRRITGGRELTWPTRSSSGTTGPKGADAALEEGLRLATGIGAGLVIAFAYKKVVVGGESADLDREVGESRRASSPSAAERAAAAGVEARTEFVEGPPAEVLCDLADADDARYIVVGSYGERPLRGVLVGATPYKLVHLSSRPVVVVRAPEPA